MLMPHVICAQSSDLSLSRELREGGQAGVHIEGPVRQAALPAQLMLLAGPAVQPGIEHQDRPKVRAPVSLA